MTVVVWSEVATHYTDIVAIRPTASAFTLPLPACAPESAPLEDEVEGPDRRWYLRRWEHALWRTQWTLLAFLTSAGLLLQSRRTADYLAVTATAGMPRRAASSAGSPISQAPSSRE